MRPFVSLLAAVGFASFLTSPFASGDEPADSKAKADLKSIPPLALDAWKEPRTNWEEVASVEVDPKNERALVAKAGSGVVYNGPAGRALNLITKEEYGDVEVSLEFNIPKRSNSGIKLEGVYEVQIYDSYGSDTLDGSTSGGVYPRAEMFPKYHHIDDGHAPKLNASIPPGEWQTLEITFHSPKFDASGKKTANAKFVKVVLNGKLVQENLEATTPTGHVWRNKEATKGPILLQGDHGPVAFRNIRIRPL